MKKQLLLGLGAIALLSACSNDHDELTGNLYDGYLHVNGTINELVKTRATETAFESNDVIGVNVASGDQNVAYKFNGTSFEAVDSKIKLENSLSVNAYYPYDEDLEGTEIEFRVNDQSTNVPVAVKDVDFLYANAVTVSPESPSATFSFTHKMSQIGVTVVDKTKDSSLTGATISVTLNKVAVTGKFNVTTGAVTTDNADGKLVISGVTAGTAQNVIVPSYAAENSAAIEVVVNVDGTNYTGSITPKLLAGNRYSYDLNIKDSETSTDPTPEDKYLEITGSITGWTDNSGDAQDLEEEYILSVGDFLLKSGKTVAPTTANATTLNDQIVGVVYFVGNPQPSNLYSEKVVSEKDILKTEHESCINGLAIAIDNADESTVQLFSAKPNYKAWVALQDAQELVTGLFLDGVGFGSATTPTQMLGYNNTRMIEIAHKSDVDSTKTVNPKCAEDLLQRIETYNTTYKVENSSGWYVPSYAEYSQIQDEYETISASLAKLQKTLIQFDEYTAEEKGQPKAENYYWTSDYRSNGNQWVSTVKTPTTATSPNMWQTPTGNGTKGYLRFAIAF